MIDWQARYTELETQLEHMLIRVADVMEHQPGASGVRADLLPSLRQVLIDNRQRPTMITLVADAIDPEYSLYLYAANGDVQKLPYQRNNTFYIEKFKIKVTRVKGFVRQRSTRARMDSKHVNLTA